MVLLVFMISSCSDSDAVVEEEIIPPLDTLSTGSGLFEYTYQVAGFSKTLKVYFFIPENKTASTPILFTFHGTERNAIDYRNTMVSDATTKGFIVIAPEFSNQNFPTGDGYNLGNVFVDGDNPSQNSLNPEDEWAFSIIEPLFDNIKTQINNSSATYHVFGHSAGAQFAHRLMLFKPEARIEKAVFSAAGWYTFPNNNIDFPYGFQESPLKNMALGSFFNKNILVQVGDNDDDPNSAGLRHNEFADAQGLNRKDRAENYFQFCQQMALNQNNAFNWNFQLIPNTGHDYIKASENAVDFLFN